MTLKQINSEFIHKNYIEGENIVGYYLLPNKKLIIPEGVENIEAFAFRKLFNLETIVLPATLKSLSPFAFDSCLNLKKINCYAPLVKVNQSSFNSCPLIEKINMNMDIINNDISLIFGANENFDFVCVPKSLKYFKLAKKVDGNIISKTFTRGEEVPQIPNEIFIGKKTYFKNIEQI